MERALGQGDDKAFHKWRIRVKRVIEPLGRAIFDQTSRDFVRELGQRWNNWRKTSSQELVVETPEPLEVRLDRVASPR